MITNWKFVRALILVGFLVLLGLNAAAQGLGKMSPDVSPSFLELSINNQTITTTVIGETYFFDAGGILNKLGYFKNQAVQLTDQCQRNTVFWIKIIIGAWEKYSPPL